MTKVNSDKLPDQSTHNSRLSGSGGKFLLLSCTLVFAFSVGEFLLRNVYPIGATVAQLDQRYLFRYRPNSREIYRFSAANGGGKLLVKINSEGRRGELVAQDRPHILVYGDSFIASSFSPIKQTFVWKLEQMLKTTASPAPQVINCGVSGYGPDQESLVFDDEIDRLKPDLVIVAIYTGNDFGDLLRHKMYKLDGQDRLISNAYVLDPSLATLPIFSAQGSRFYTLRLFRRAWDRLGELRAPVRPAIPGKEHSDFIGDWLRNCREEYEEYILRGNNVVWDLVKGHYDADVALTPNSESSRYKRILMDRVIGKLKMISARRSVPVMLLVIPSPIDVVENYSVTVDSRKYPQYRRQALTDAVEEIARRYQLSYVNLFKPFREHVGASLYYVVDNDHWNPQGQELAASLVAEYIEREGMLDKSVRASDGTHN